MNDQRKLSGKGAALIKSFESCQAPAGAGKFKAYFCPARVLTIGWGHTNDNGRQFTAEEVWTQQDCDVAFNEDMAVFEGVVKTLVRVALNQDQFDALVSFAYNCGQGNLQSSTL